MVTMKVHDLNNSTDIKRYFDVLISQKHNLPNINIILRDLFKLFLNVIVTDHNIPLQVKMISNIFSSFRTYYS